MAIEPTSCEELLRGNRTFISSHFLGSIHLQTSGFHGLCIGEGVH